LLLGDGCLSYRVPGELVFQHSPTAVLLQYSSWERKEEKAPIVFHESIAGLLACAKDPAARAGRLQSSKGPVAGPGF
jgi:hypothetical protein